MRRVRIGVEAVREGNQGGSESVPGGAKAKSKSKGNGRVKGDFLCRFIGALSSNVAAG